jgi:hypothetical protein
VLTEGLVIEGASKTENCVTLVDTDNPQVGFIRKVDNGQLDWEQRMAPQELHREQLKWQFNSGDAEFLSRMVKRTLRTRAISRLPVWVTMA